MFDVLVAVKYLEVIVLIHMLWLKEVEAAKYHYNVLMLFFFLLKIQEL